MGHRCVVIGSQTGDKKQCFIKTKLKMQLIIKLAKQVGLVKENLLFYNFWVLKKM